jgi:hypothetical protein
MMTYTKQSLAASAAFKRASRPERQRATAANTANMRAREPTPAGWSHRDGAERVGS